MSETETVTVLFTDLVDSTGLLVRHGPEETERLRRDHFRLLRGSFEGLGREVKGTGDGLMVIFHSSAAGLAPL